MFPIACKYFIIGALNVKGLVKKRKERIIGSDVDNYTINASFLQESKVKVGLDINIGVSKAINTS